MPRTRPEEACEALSRLLASPGVTVHCPGAEYPALLSETIREANATGNPVFDAQIVAVCRQSGVSRLVTEDRDFNHFKGPSVVRIE